MDVSAAPLVKGANFFCRLPPSASSRRNALRKGPESCIFFFKVPSWRCSSTARRGGRGILQISARAWRPSRRRNTLREKILPSTAEHEQGRGAPKTLDTVPDLELPEDSGVGLEDCETFTDADGKNEAVEDVPSESGALLKKKSALWDKLEDWVDQYKLDSEFWGAGTGPVFMIHQDSEKKIVRVMVNEDEIIKRSRAQAFSQEEAETTIDVNSKIFRAKLIARMIESGEYALPRNSSVVKFVVEGKKSFFEGLRSISLQGQQPFPKMFPRVGFFFLCSCCILWASLKLFIQNEKVELSREEAEMLRRKIKLRIEREEMEKGSVKVLDDLPELPVASRPQLDRNELMKSIVQAKASLDKSFMADSFSDLNVKPRDFDDKVKEIRQMARKIREQEQKDDSETKTSKGTEIGSMQPKNRQSVTSKNVDLKTEGKDDASGTDITSINSLSHQEVDTKYYADRKNREMVGKDFTEHLNRTAYQESLNSVQDGENSMDKVDQYKMGSTGCSIGEQSSEVNTKSIMNSDAISSGSALINGDKLGKNELHNSLSEEGVNNSNSSGVSKFKPKVITSVEEAKEYLAQKHGMLFETVQPELDSDKHQSAGANASDHLVDGKVTDCISLKNTEDMSIVEIQVKNNSDVLSENPHQILLSQNSVNGALNVSDSETDSKLDSDEIFNGSTDKIDLQNASSSLKVKSKKHKGAQEQRIECTSSNFDKRIEIEIPAASSSHGVESLIASPSRDDTVSQSQELDALKDENQLCEEPQGLHDETEKWDVSNDKDKRNDTYSSEIKQGKDSCLDIGSGAKEETMIVGTSDVVCSTGLTLSSYDDYLHSMSEKQDNNDSVAKVSEELEALKSYTTPLEDGTTARQNMNSILGSPGDSSNDPGEATCLTKGKQLNSEKSWVEENFQEFDPVISKIGVGFKENYMSAKEKVQQQPNLSTNIAELSSVIANDELEWMNDEKLQRIVFQVRDNELAGRDPFHSMTADDKLAFFKGLEDKAEKVNGKLLHLHEWLHSRIENLDYGADGISVNDPLKKIIPRWKGPPIDTDPEFLSYQKPIFTEQDSTEKSLQETQDRQNPASVPDSPVSGIRKMSLDSSSTPLKTMIESSDGTIRAGKKNGKEHWQHTKKWSKGFLEVYNAETDPEIKSIMRDMGKDLDRWITEKETQDVADLMDAKIPKKKRRYIAKKLEKLKQEVQMFGAPAVVSKYREFTDEKEEDYLWWLDLPFVLCLELYTIEEGTPKVGFYSLEMAADLELNPKQYHVIAFEDPGDCKNFSYILQAHMDMLGSGKAFAVARPPKDAFREAKANGFSVTVIRKGQIKLNVDQTLEEVEEEITEIGSKIYHDKIMRERSVDANTILKGAIAAEKINKTTKRRPKRTRRKPTKPAKP